MSTSKFCYQHLARKRFGQNFLRNKHIIDFIIASICPKSKQAMIEIGPGFGAITKSIINYVDSLTVIELDLNLVNYLMNDPYLHSKINIIHQDVMNIDFKILALDKGKPLRVFGNLPYNVSIPIIFHLFKYNNYIIDMHFMLQKEVVDRLMAKPNNKSYGRLSVIAQYFCKMVRLIEVPPTSFNPKPKVNSTVIRLIPYVKMPFIVFDVNKLFVLTKIAFNQRRKILRNSLRDLFNTQELIDHGINPFCRAENLSIEQYCCLANILSMHNIT